MKYIPPSLYYRFYSYGKDCRIASNGVMSLPEQTAFGTGVMVREGYRLDITVPSAGESSLRIVIGDRCDCNRFLTIHAVNRVELKPGVITGPHVFISDARQIWEKEDNNLSKLVIGEGSWIGAHSSILGNVKIGKGCVVGAGSVVMRDIPDYCVVAGNPAEFRRIYEPSSGEWVRVNSETEARELLENRREEPLLSICLAVRNQAGGLRRCLESIYAQTDDAGLIEVCVLDDASEDDTEDVARHYGIQHRSFHYHHKPVSSGKDLFKVADMARGKFVMLHDPEIPFLQGSLTPFLNVLHTHSECAIVLIQPAAIHRSPQTEELEGLSEFVRHSAIGDPPSLPFVLNREGWESTANLVQAGNYINPMVFRQYELLQSNPHFCLCRSKLTDPPIYLHQLL
ncbi:MULTISPECIES: glycosyltransferase [unclassified Paenibacillus]|uniref:glycosyltransferase n=1 Tax=unclassified Paenibacillus TaxID=185978 RepID=UPI0030F9D471